jgi:hypothetical protein
VVTTRDRRDGGRRFDPRAPGAQAARSLRGDDGTPDPTEQAYLRLAQAEADQALIARHEAAEAERAEKLAKDQAEAMPWLTAAQIDLMAAQAAASRALGVALDATGALRAARDVYVRAWENTTRLGLDVPERIAPVGWADAAHRISDDLANG